MLGINEKYGILTLSDWSRYTVDTCKIEQMIWHDSTWGMEWNGVELMIKEKMRGCMRKEIEASKDKWKCVQNSMKRTEKEGEKRN